MVVLACPWFEPASVHALPVLARVLTRCLMIAATRSLMIALAAHSEAQHAPARANSKQIPGGWGPTKWTGWSTRSSRWQS
eukprot:8366224-Alexandrium_andersonii.AAC.1